MIENSSSQGTVIESSRPEPSYSSPLVSSQGGQPIALRAAALIAAIVLRWFDKLSMDWTGAVLITVLAPTVVAGLTTALRKGAGR